MTPGLAKNIGVSNFRIADLELIFKTSKVKPVVNQIEFHPYLQQPKLCKFLADHEIRVQGYSPLVPLTAKPEGPLSPVLEKIAAKKGKTTAQVIFSA